MEQSRGYRIIRTGSFVAPREHDVPLCTRRSDQCGQEQTLLFVRLGLRNGFESFVRFVRFTARKKQFRKCDV